MYYHVDVIERGIREQKTCILWLEKNDNFDNFGCDGTVSKSKGNFKFYIYQSIRSLLDVFIGAR